jgi:hypothetical protein
VGEYRAHACAEHEPVVLRLHHRHAVRVAIAQRELATPISHKAFAASRANPGLCTAQHSGRAQYAPVGTDATPSAMCELSSAEVRGAAESHMQMLQHYTRLSDAMAVSCCA